MVYCADPNFVLLDDGEDGRVLCYGALPATAALERMLQGNVESVTPSTRAFRVWGDGIDITAHTHDASGCQTYEDRY